MQGIKKWHVARQSTQSLEYRAWEAVLTLWLMGWIGWLPAWVFGARWAFPLCLLAMVLPQAYLHARVSIHAAGWLRCDWLQALQ
jgi:hypothetical protein